jgi:hypothetical protein
VADSRIVNTVRVDDERAEESAQVDEVVPFTAIPGEARRFDAEDGPDLARAHVSHEALEPGALERAGSRSSEVLVDDLDPLEAELGGMLRERVLTLLALSVLEDLRHRRLPDVDGRATLAVLIKDLLAHPFLLPSRLRRAALRREVDRPGPRRDDDESRRSSPRV